MAKKYKKTKNLKICRSSRVFQLQDSQHSFQDCMDYILPGLHRKHSTTPSPRQHHCSLHCCGFSLLIDKSSSFLSYFHIFWQNIRIFVSADWAVISISSIAILLSPRCVFQYFAGKYFTQNISDSSTLYSNWDV